MRVAVIDKDLVTEECTRLIIKDCPVNRTGKECIVLGEDGKPIINEELCIGCGICVKRCPKGAITIVSLPEELHKNCLHRYGENGFALYKAPIPSKGEVLGILGQNGTGKSTAIKILSNQIKPNLGKEREATKEELKKFFAGSELQSYFEDIDKKKIAYKPQDVDKIPKVFEGTVRELLKQADERGIFEKITRELEMLNCLDTSIKEISGGELQKTAIAATIMKDAEVYFFDEPSSYLDVRERLRIAQTIRKLAKEKLVVLVEHDLIVLDYLADRVQVFYGKPAAYGIVSFPKSVRLGINEYLKGYLREENIRFRDQPLKFIVKAPTGKGKATPLITFEGIKKKFGKFQLEVQKGEIYNKEIVGILGPNATGKTTFMKILAGALEADEGSFSREIKISYKPQYIKPEEDLLVMLALKGVSKKLISKLGLEKLMEKTLFQLSGGELQRVSIASCLSKDADLYLLDEPSAHLDVEQRINVADILRKEIELKEKAAVVIDHDIMFLDYISDRLMPFLGESGKYGVGKGPFDMKEGMNLFLKDLGITFRRDEETKRPRANKEGSVLDREQKEKGEYYYQ